MVFVYVFGQSKRESTLLVGARIISGLTRFPSILQFIIYIP